MALTVRKGRLRETHLRHLPRSKLRPIESKIVGIKLFATKEQTENSSVYGFYRLKFYSLVETQLKKDLYMTNTDTLLLDVVYF
jgi:hypothetical protein